MHLAFLTPEYPHSKSTPSGGLGTSIQNISKSLVAEGIKVTVFIYGQEQNKISTEEGLHFHFIKQQHYKLFGWYRYRKYLEVYLNKIILKEKIDAMEAPDWTGITAFMSLKCPLVIRFHGSDSYFCRMEKRSQKKKNFWFEKFALLGADHLLSVSKFTADTTREIFDLKNEIKVISNSVDVAKFYRDTTEPVPKTILYFGSIIRKKGVLELAHIFNLIHNADPEIQLILAGRDVQDIHTKDSTLKIFKNTLSSSARNKLSYKGSLAYSEIFSEIQSAAVVVLPSFAEALPMTWLEAMAMEKAMVTSNIGWAPEVMVDGKTGFTVYPGDHEKYSEKILELINNPVLSRKMGAAARMIIIDKFSSQIIVAQNIGFYSSLLKIKN